MSHFTTMLVVPGPSKNYQKNHLQCMAKIVQKVTLLASHFGPIFETRIFFSDGRAFLRGPVSGSVLGSVLTPIFNRKVLENKAEKTREREGS